MKLSERLKLWQAKQLRKRIEKYVSFRARLDNYIRRDKREFKQMIGEFTEEQLLIYGQAWMK